MQLDHSLESRLLVNTEQVTYVSVRRTGDMVDTVEGVRRHQVNLKEPAPSFMTYQTGDVNFFVPRLRVSQALGELKAGEAAGEKLSPMQRAALQAVHQDSGS